MKTKINALLMCEAVICVLLAIVYDKATVGNIFEIFKWPLEVMADVLREMSWSGTIGNAFAIILYGVLGLIPIAYLFYRAKKKNAGVEDAMLPLISGAFFVIMYLFINQSLILKLDGIITVSNYKDELAVSFYSVLALYITIRIVKGMDRTKKNKLISAIKCVCLITMIVLVASTFFFGTINLLAEYEQAKTNNQFVTNTMILVTVRTLIAFIPDLLMAIIVGKLMKVSESVIRGEFTEEVLDGINNIATNCKRFIVGIMSAIMVMNFAQLLATGHVSISNYRLVFPIFELLLLAIIMLISKLIYESKSMKDYNELFI